MRVAFSLLELLVAISMLGIIASFFTPSTKHALHQAAITTLAYIRYTQHLALNDSLTFRTMQEARMLTKLHPSIDPKGLLDSHKNLWQIQFHQKGIYTRNSISIFFDTPRFKPTTNRDYQPRAGDIIAINGANARCLSAYNRDNIAIKCRDNADVLTRLEESFGIESIELLGDIACQEMMTFRIGFTHEGTPLCLKHTRALAQPLRIILRKNGAEKSICVLPYSGYAYIAPSCQPAIMPQTPKLRS